MLTSAKIGVNKRYCAIVNGKLCNKYVSMDGSAPEQSVRTAFFDDENPGKAVFWVPIHILDPNESEVVEAMSDYFLIENYPIRKKVLERRFSLRLIVMKRNSSRNG